MRSLGSNPFCIFLQSSGGIFTPAGAFLCCIGICRDAIHNTHKLNSGSKIPHKRPPKTKRIFIIFAIKKPPQTPLTKRKIHAIIKAPHAEGSFFVRPHGGHHAAPQVFRNVRCLYPKSCGRISAEGGTTKACRTPRRPTGPHGKYPKFYRRCRTHESENYSCLQRMQTAQL